MSPVFDGYVGVGEGEAEVCGTLVPSLDHRDSLPACKIALGRRVL